MDCNEDVEWIRAEIETIKATIAAVRAAILALTIGGVSQYSLATGQTTQSVTKQNLGSLRLMIPDLQNQLRQYQNQLCGGAVIQVRPGW